jgi:AAA domain/Toprim-like
MTAIENMVGALTDAGSNPRETGGAWTALCPAHEDRNPSLSARGIEGQALVYCHAGCDTSDVLAALNLTMRDLYDEPSGATYNYDDGRKVHRTPDKKFRQSGATKGASVLYRLPEVIEAVAHDQTIYVVEGEKDVHALEAIGVVATTSPMGAGSFGKVDASPLTGAHVVLVADKDAAGTKYAATAQEILLPLGCGVEVVHAKAGKDASDHVAAGHGVDDFVPFEIGEEVAPRRARITWASEIEPEPVVWAWEPDGQGRIPAGSLTIAAGREGTGKSSFGMWMAAQITKGALPGAYLGKPRKVFYVAVEDSWKHTLVPRLLAAGADLNMIGRFEVVNTDDDELTLSLPHDNLMLEREVTFHHVALVVIDPLMSVIGEKIDTHREREVRSALDPLAKMADRTGSIFLGIAHFNKGGGTDAASLITGSGAFKNVPRSVFGFARDDSDDSGSRVMSQVKNSLGRDDLPSLAYVIESAEIDTKKGVAVTGRFTFTGESERSVADVLRDSRGGTEDQDERKEATDWLVDYLKSNGSEAPAKDIYRAGQNEGYSKDTLKRAKGRKVRSAKVGDSWVWQLVADEDGTPEDGKGAPREQGSREQKRAPLLPCLLPSRSGPRPQNRGPTANRGPTEADLRVCEPSQDADSQLGQWGHGSERRRDSDDSTPPRPTCSVCNQLLLMTIAGRTVCAARDDKHDAARAAEAVA